MIHGLEKPELDTVRLQNAVFCAECEVISNSPHDLCWVCGSRSLVSLSRLLGGPLSAQRTRLIESTVEQTFVASPPLVLAPRPHRRSPRRRKYAA